MKVFSVIDVVRCVAVSAAIFTAQLSMPTPVIAETLAEFVITDTDARQAKRKNSFKVSTSSSPITIRSFADRSKVIIATKMSGPKFSVEKLSNPARLVIDINGERLPRGAGLATSNAAFVSAVRVGSHPTKSRVVVDLKGASDLVHTATTEANAIVIEISARNVLVNSVVTVSQGKRPLDLHRGAVTVPAPQVKQSALDLDEEVLVSGSSSSVKTLATLAPSEKVVMQPREPLIETKSENPVMPVAAAADRPKMGPAVTNAQGANVLQSVSLEGQGKTPSVTMGIKGDAAYSMDRTAPSEYVLTLRQTSADEALVKQTLFTSKDSNGIRSVRTTRDGDNTLVRIFTQPSSYLTARRNGDKLVVEETQDLTQIARDIRAQLDPAALKDGKAARPSPAKGDAQSGSTPPPPPASPPQKEATDAKMISDPVVSNPGEAKPDNTGAAKQPAPNRRSESELAAMKGSSATYTGRLISLDLQDADIDSALRIIAEVSNLNIVAGDGVTGKVTLKLVDVPWDQALDVMLKNQGLDKVLEGNVLRVAPVDRLKSERESLKQARVAQEELEPLSVKYMRISYAKASEIKALVETVLTERGTVAFDERSNQLVVKDVRAGLQNVTELIRKVDLRTPQILLETQIIEANRNLSRQLGSELGFQYIQSPATGNGTGLNFPSAIALGGSVDPTNANSITGSAFPIATTAAAGSAVTMLFDSADGTKSLALRLSQLEQEGQVRIISKPAVATTNNKPAEIKSVEKYRVKLPNGGLSIATGSGAQSSGAGNVATQTIEAGIVLNVTPQASPDYYILLDIQAKSSSFGSKSVEGIPNEIERSASSSVLVSSGQTFALGGIYKITERDSVSGVPFFKDIPVLGTFFRSATTENSDEELLFFITPRIVEGSFEDASMKVVS